MSRNGILAAVMSLFVPGLGQMYAGKGGRGAAILLAVIVVGNLNTIFLILFAASDPVLYPEWGPILPRILHDLFAAYGVVFLLWQVADAYGQGKAARQR